MIQRPEWIKVGPYDINFVVLDRDSEHETWGHFSKHNQEIGLAREFPSPQIAAETMLHEILHAIWWTQQIKPKDGEERIVSMLGIGLSQVMRDNPNVVEWLRMSLAGSRKEKE